MSTSTNKQIAKNTLLLYIRMVVMTIVNLYTSRVILNALGIEDFGAYNVVGGFVVLFTFLNGPLSTATQRFMNYEIGLKRYDEVTKIFSISLLLYAFISLSIILLGETLGLWFLNNKMSFPVGRMGAIGVIYQLSIATILFQVIRIPYNSAIISYERMQFFAYVSLLEAFLQLGIAFIINSTNGDRLVLYGWLLAAINLLITLVYYLYCRGTFEAIRFKTCWDKDKWYKLISFSGWSLFGSCANVAALHGVNIILNIFGGVVINAAVGVANQASSAIYKMVSNFQMAFNPQIVKLYAQRAHEPLISLVISSSKYSFFLLYIIALPASLSLEFLIKLWLGSVPEYSVGFCQLMLLFMLVDALSAPLWMLVQATGDIRKYQIIISSIIASNIPVCLLLMWCHFDYMWVFGIKAIINLGCHIYRLVYLKHYMAFPCSRYLSQAVFPILYTICLSAPLPLYLYWNQSNAVLIIASSIVTSIIAIAIVGLSQMEKAMIISKFKSYKKR